MRSNNWSAEKQRRKRRIHDFTFQSLMTAIAVVFVLLAFIPIFLMLFLSLKNQAQFYGTLINAGLSAIMWYRHDNGQVQWSAL